MAKYRTEFKIKVVKNIKNLETHINIIYLIKF